jgi:hypothetical protein
LVIPVKEVIKSMRVLANDGREDPTLKRNLISIIMEWNKDPKQKYIKLFLKFVTGKRHFRMEHIPKIRVEVTAASIDSLPTASTCVHTLRVPDYSTRDMMKEKMEQALENCGTFEFV